MALRAERMHEFNQKLSDIISSKVFGTRIIFDDPAGNSYLQNVYAPEDDPEMEVVHYERTFEHNEELGLNDMKVENYQEDDHWSYVLFCSYGFYGTRFFLVDLFLLFHYNFPFFFNSRLKKL